MPRRRLPLSIALLVVVALAGSLALVGCGSGGGSENGRGEKVSDVVGLGNDTLGHFAIASSRRGTVAAVWERDSGSSNDARLQLSELEPGSWRWSKPETVVTGTEGDHGMAADLVIGYDGLGRLLVAWAADLGRGHNGKRWGVKARIRSATGEWKQERLIARLPDKEASGVESPGLKLSTGAKGFALSWYARTWVEGHAYPNVSGYRILRENRWSAPVNLGADGVPLLLELPDKGQPLVLWMQPPERRLVFASIRLDGRLGKIRTLAKGNSYSAFLTTCSFGNRIAAAWVYQHNTWASIWNGRRWSRPARFGENGGAEGSIAVAITRDRAAVTWINAGQNGVGGSYSLESDGVWSPPTPLTPDSNAVEVGAGGLTSGELILLGSGYPDLEVAHLPSSGEASYERFEAPVDVQRPFFAASPRAVAFAREHDSGWESKPDPHIFVWVYRP